MRLLNIDKEAVKKLLKIDKPTRWRIIKGIAGLFKEPPEGDIKSLKGALQGLNRLRVGDWRITYEVTDNSIDILTISPRGGAYKKGAI